MNIAVVYKKMPGMILDVTEKELQMVKDACPNDTVVFARTYQGLYDQGFKADIIIGGHPVEDVNEGEISFEEYISWAASVRWIHVLFAGVEGVANSPALADGSIRLTNSGGIHGIPISDHVMAFILCFMRCIPEALSNKANHIWARPQHADETYEKTLGIIGIGKIGTELAARAKAFHMRVLGYKHTPSVIPNVDEVLCGEDGLDKLLRESDFVVLLLPHTKETDNFMDAEKFAKMKPSAYFINNGRGKCVDDNALISALQDGQIAGAALDAHRSEPIAVDSPLWDMDNVILTAHYGGDTCRAMERATSIFIENYPRFIHGEPLRNVIDLDKKY